MRKTTLIVLIVGIAFLVRVVDLAKYPTGLTPDEAAQGFTAYSLLTTSKDEWGNAWPINLRSFGDFKPPLYTYVTIPAVATFGLNEFSVRLPSALMGTLAVLFTYLLTIKLTNDRRIGLLAAGLLAISPWHISLSRGAFEANLSTALLTGGVYFFLKGFEKSPYLLASALLFGLNLFSYHSARLVTPIILVALVFWKVVRHSGERLATPESAFAPTSRLGKGRFFDCQNDRYRLRLVSFVLFIMFFVVSAVAFLVGGATRSGDIAIFHPTDNWGSVADARFEAVKAGLPDPIARLFTNKITYSMNIFTKNYLSYFSPDFLFLHGAGEGTYGMIPGRGVLYLFEMVTVGVAFLLFILTFRHSGDERSEESRIFPNQPMESDKGGFWSSSPRSSFGGAGQNDTKKVLVFLLFWIAIAAVPAALAKGYHAANRDAIAMPAWQILSAIGLIYVYDIMVSKWSKYRRHMQYAICGIIVLSFLTFAYDYIYHAPVQNAKAMHYGMREAADFIKANESQYQHIVISRKLSEPQAYAGFYGLVTPEQFQLAAPYLLAYEQEGKSFLDQLGEYWVGKYIFKEIPFGVKLDPSTLYVGTFEELHDSKGIVKQINYQNGDPTIILARL